MDRTEKIVGTPNGIFVVQAVRRVPGQRRYNAEMLNAIKGKPWNPQPDSTGGQVPEAEPVILQPEVLEHLAQPPASADERVIFKRIYITKADPERHGYTVDCSACEASRLGSRKPGILHTQGCRDRIEKSLGREPACKAKKGAGRDADKREDGQNSGERNPEGGQQNGRRI